MKNINYVALVIIGLFFLISCSTPPEDVPKAEINSGQNQPEENQAPNEPEAIVGADASTVNAEISREAIDKARSNFEFEGYGIGKSHVGTFEDWEGALLYEDGKIIGISGTVQASSVETDIDGLNNHLKSCDFFCVEEYPEIKFTSKSLEGDIMYGDLTFLGVTREISFPIEITDESISTEFLLDTAMFGMSYKGVDPEVRLSFTFAK